MTNLLTQAEVQQRCEAVGFSKWAARVASAIAMCEAPAEDGSAHADFDRIGDQSLANETWGYSYGGFQIRSIREQKGTGEYRDEDRLLRPRFNCKSALIIKRQQGWDAWSVYTSGMYKAYLQEEFPPPPNTYVVLSGDTLSKIGQKFGLPWEEIARVNNLHSPYRLSIGQHLLLS